MRPAVPIDRKRHASCAKFVVFCLLSAVARAADADPKRVAAVVRQLAAAAPGDREAACLDLMTLSPGELPVLRDAVAAAAPVLPEQADALRRVVTYVLTRAAVLQLPAGNVAFLGVHPVPTVIGPDDGDEPIGAVIDYLAPGFAAARCLSVGDVLLGFGIGGRPVWVTREHPVVEIISALKPGTTIDVFISRSGRPLTFTVALDARPDYVRQNDTAALDKLVDEAETDAETTFVSQFGRWVGVD